MSVVPGSYGGNRPQWPGRLFIVEGIDGSGKSTQLTLLSQWLRSEGYPVVFSEWNSSPIVRPGVEKRWPPQTRSWCWGSSRSSGKGWCTADL